MKSPYHCKNCFRGFYLGNKICRDSFCACHKTKSRLHSSVKFSITRQLAKKYGNKCAICKKKMELGDCNIDHKVPLLFGGSNHISNLQLTHPACNEKKGIEDHQLYKEMRF